MPPKYTFVSFQGIINGFPQGMAKFILPIVSALLDDTKNNIIYYLRNIENSKFSFTYDLGIIYNLLSRIINLLNRYIIRLPNYKMRYFHERFFDYMFSMKIKNPTIIISTAYLLKSTRKNHKLGGKNIFVAGNPDDYEIHKLLLDEQRIHQVVFNDAYTYKRRIEFGYNSILSFDHIISATISEYDSFSKRIPVEKITYIEDHILPNPKTFPDIEIKKNKELTFCFVAHPFWLKGLPYLLEAWSGIDKQNIKLRIAGSIDDQLQQFIDKNYSNLRNVEYLGYVNDLNEFFRTSHVCIVPSLLDAGPATVAEAMFCELPVIVSDGCGSKSLVQDYETGFVVESGNSNLIAKRIKWFIKNYESIDLMGKNAKSRINNLIESNQSEDFANHIKEIIASLNNI